MTPPRQKRPLQVVNGRRVLTQAERDARRARRIERLRRLADARVEQVARLWAGKPRP